MPSMSYFVEAVPSGSTAVAASSLSYEPSTSWLAETVPSMPEPAVRPSTSTPVPSGLTVIEDDEFFLPDVSERILQRVQTGTEAPSINSTTLFNGFVVSEATPPPPPG